MLTHLHQYASINTEYRSTWYSVLCWGRETSTMFENMLLHERIPSQRPTKSMVPLRWNVHGRQTHRQNVGESLAKTVGERGEHWGVTADENGVYFGGDGNVLRKLIVTTVPQRMHRKLLNIHFNVWIDSMIHTCRHSSVSISERPDGEEGEVKEPLVGRPSSLSIWSIDQHEAGERRRVPSHPCLWTSFYFCEN